MEQIIPRRILIPALLGLIFTMAALFLAQYFLPQEYSAQTQLLVVRNKLLVSSSANVESAEEISYDLTKAIQTNLFLEHVIDSQRIDLTELMVLEDSKRRKIWKRKVETEAVTNTSFLNVKAYDENPDRAEDIINAIVYVLQERGSEFYGADKTVSLQVVDAVLVSHKPVRPNMVLIGFIAGCAGLMIGLGIVFLRVSIQTSDETGEWLAEVIRSEIEDERPEYSTGHFEAMSTGHDDYQVLHVENYHLYIDAKHVQHRQDFEEDLEDGIVRHLHDHNFK